MLLLNYSISVDVFVLLCSLVSFASEIENNSGKWSLLIGLLVLRILTTSAEHSFLLLLLFAFIYWLKKSLQQHKQKIFNAKMYMAIEEKSATG